MGIAEPSAEGLGLRWATRLRWILERVGLVPSPPPGLSFHAFISYSHAADGKLAPALQVGLQRFAKAWYRARALHVFRDQASMAVNPSLWEEIKQALDAAEFYVLLASPRAAQSDWVRQEAQYWRARKPPNRLLLALTDGELVWPHGYVDFDWEQTTALPIELKGAFPDRPLWVDLRWARGENDLSLDHPRFRDAVATLAARLHHRPKYELTGEEVIQQKRAVRARRIAASALLLLTTVAVIAGFVALSERAKALHQAGVSQSELLAARAAAATNLPTAALAALEAYRTAPTVDARNEIYTLSDNQELGPPLNAHSGPVGSVAWSPDGALIASGPGNTVRFWDARTRRIIPTGSGGPSAGGWVVAFSPDGRTAVAGGNTLDWWRVSAERVNGLRVKDTGVFITSVAFNHAGTLLATGDENGQITLWNVAGRQQLGEPLIAYGGESINELLFTPNGRELIAISSNTVQFFNLRTRQRVGPLLVGYNNLVTAVALSPNGRLLAIASGQASGPNITNAIMLVDLRTDRQQVPPMVGHTDTVEALAFDHSGNTLASAGADGTIRLWNPVTRLEIGAPLTGHQGAVQSIAFSSDDTKLISGGVDGTVRLWSYSPHEIGPPLVAGPQAVNDVTFTRDGTHLFAATADGQIEFWDLRTRRASTPLFRTTGGYVLALSPNGRILAVGGDRKDTLQLWDRRTGRLTKIRSPDDAAFATADALAFSPDSRSVASVENDTIRIWSAASHRQLGRPYEDPTNDATFTSIAFSPDGRLLAAGADDNTIWLWDLQSHHLVHRFRGHTDTVLAVAFSRAGTMLASGSQDDTIRIWNVNSGRQIGVPLVGHTGPVESVAFSPDGRTLASGSDDTTVRLWDVASQTELGSPLSGHMGAVNSVAFSPDGRVVASASADHSIRLWSNDPIPVYLRQLCGYVNLAVARRAWVLNEPGIAYRRPC